MAENIVSQDKILEVKDLRISFRADAGTVKAVRGISFSLYRGRTLAIVGESGSGKSVTSKAILGILANNKIVEDGQIIYDGKDLLKISEEQFTKIRGVKISMIFQDPLSSLNPIMIVGKQLTEAMVLKNKADRKAAHKLIAKVEKSVKLTNPAAHAALVGARENKGEADVSAIISEALEASLARQNEAIAAVKPTLAAIRDNYFSAENVDIDAACGELVKTLSRLKATVMDIAIEADNDIIVFPTVVKETHKAAKEALVMEKKRDANLTKYGVSSIYDLPPAVRAKMREVIRTQSDYAAQLKSALDALLDRLTYLEGLASDAESKAVLASHIVNAYSEAIINANKKLSKKEADEKAVEMLRSVGIPEPERRFKQYPFELSGGMRQRIVIAIALCSSPEVLICDEPTTALDVTIQSQILELINQLKAERNLSIVFITHDLGVVANMADDIAVMYAGKIVEMGTAKDIFYDPRHPYTWALLGSVPDLNTKGKLNAIPGTPPNMLLPPKGDAFAIRNEQSLAIDALVPPPFFTISPTHVAATWNVHESAPEIDVPDVVVNRIRAAITAHPESKPSYDNPKNSILGRIEGGK